jgi:hypothetical protein
MNRSTLNAPAVIGNLVESSHCVRGKTETAQNLLEKRKLNKVGKVILCEHVEVSGSKSFTFNDRDLD